jgi:hypothetical protein
MVAYMTFGLAGQVGGEALHGTYAVYLLAEAINRALPASRRAAARRRRAVRACASLP